jgi:hypothetical protein
MYQLVGVWKLLTVFALTAVMVALALWILVPPDGPLMFLRRPQVSVSAVGLLALALGQTKAFPWLCQWPLIRDIFPPIEGEWIGTLNTNFPKIAAAFELDAPEAGKAVVATFKIKARLLKVRVSSLSVQPRPGYMRSDTTALSIVRCPQTDREIMYYVYDAFVGDPEECDVPSFHGAAKLVLLREEGNMVFEGNYWTDRNWQKGYNTAGSIKLVKASSALSP